MCTHPEYGIVYQMSLTPQLRCCSRPHLCLRVHKLPYLGLRFDVKFIVQLNYVITQPSAINNISFVFSLFFNRYVPLRYCVIHTLKCNGSLIRIDFHGQCAGHFTFQCKRRLPASFPAIHCNDGQIVLPFLMEVCPYSYRMF